MSKDEPGECRPVASSAPPPELHSEQDMLAWKREYNIRQREADWKRRQEEMLSQKQVRWEIERVERENRFASAREKRRKDELEQRVHQRHVEVDRRYKDRCRAVEVNRRAQAWEEKENSRLVALNRAAQEEAERHEEATQAEKARLWVEMRDQAAERAEKKQLDADLQRKREENIRKKELLRQARAAENARKLKTDAKAKSEAIVNAFTERTVPSDALIVGRAGQAALQEFDASVESAL
mmetsp:Transcript_111941/g.316382  ORF Transcript_111941/g.316382 Transcript_111941/m.316382 type:complete len:239 (-) Transcript_111941:74-790(-)